MRRRWSAALLAALLLAACGSNGSAGGENDTSAGTSPTVAVATCRVSESRFLTTLEADLVLARLSGVAAVDITLDVYESAGEKALILSKTVHQSVVEDPQAFHMGLIGTDQVDEISVEPFVPECRASVGQVYMLP